MLTVTLKSLELPKQRQQQFTIMFDRFPAPFHDDDRLAFVHSFEMIWQLIDQYHLQSKKK